MISNEITSNEIRKDSIPLKDPGFLGYLFRSALFPIKNGTEFAQLIHCKCFVGFKSHFVGYGIRVVGRKESLSDFYVECFAQRLSEKKNIRIVDYEEDHVKIKQIFRYTELRGVSAQCRCLCTAAAPRAQLMLNIYQHHISRKCLYPV